MSSELFHRIEHHAQNRGDALALVELNSVGGCCREINYCELIDDVHALSTLFTPYMSTPQVVIVSLPNNIATVLISLAIRQAGGIAFPVDGGITLAELERIVVACGARLAVGDRKSTPKLESAGLSTFNAQDGGDVDSLFSGVFELPPTVDWIDVPGLMLQSSGTTGGPKIVYRDAQSLDAVARNVAHSVRLTPEDRVLGLVPVSHSYGMENAFTGPLWAGACVHLLQGFDVGVVQGQLEMGGITVFPGVPAIFEMLASRGVGATYPALRCAYSAGAILPQSVFDAFFAHCGIRLGQLYGATEIGSVTFNNPDDSEHDPTSVGMGMKDAEIRTVAPKASNADSHLAAGEEGEVLVRAASMMRGYVDVDESPFVDGFFRTGDLGRLDERGRLTITGRMKLLIEVGSLKVNPLEVEDVIKSHAAVRDCIVMPLHITATINRIRALVELNEGFSENVLPTIREHAQDKLSPHKIPRRIDVVGQFPRSPTGKVLRQLL